MAVVSVINQTAYAILLTVDDSSILLLAETEPTGQSGPTDSTMSSVGPKTASDVSLTLYTQHSIADNAVIYFHSIISYHYQAFFSRLHTHEFS